MNKIRGTYWPSGARFLSVVSYWKRANEVPGQDCKTACNMDVFFFMLSIMQAKQYLNNFRNLLPGIQSLNC